MRAARFHSYGPPDVLVIDDAPEPHAGDGSVRIRVRATSVNPIDFLLRAGRLTQSFALALPAIPGRDAVGVVDEVGPGVTDARVGDVVFGAGGVSATTAEFAVLTAWSAVPPAPPRGGRRRRPPQPGSLLSPQRPLWKRWVMRKVGRCSSKVLPAR